MNTMEWTVSRERGQQEAMMDLSELLAIVVHDSSLLCSGQANPAVAVVHVYINAEYILLAEYTVIRKFCYKNNLQSKFSAIIFSYTMMVCENYIVWKRV